MDMKKKLEQIAEIKERIAAMKAKSGDSVEAASIFDTITSFADKLVNAWEEIESILEKLTGLFGVQKEQAVAIKRLENQIKSVVEQKP